MHLAAKPVAGIQKGHGKPDRGKRRGSKLTRLCLLPITTTSTAGCAMMASYARPRVEKMLAAL